jgi:hypothetical protein
MWSCGGVRLGSFLVAHCPGLTLLLLCLGRCPVPKAAAWVAAAPNVPICGVCAAEAARSTGGASAGDAGPGGGATATVWVGGVGEKEPHHVLGRLIEWRSAVGNVPRDLQGPFGGSTSMVRLHLSQHFCILAIPLCHTVT